MRRSHATSAESAPAPPPSFGPASPLLVHELNSLLDGSIRSVGLALRRISEAAGAGAVAESDLEEATKRMDAAQTAMRQMAQMLQRAMQPNAKLLDAFDERLPLSDCIRKIIDSLEPLIRSGTITIRMEVEPAVESISSGPLGTVIFNALRNAVQAAICCPQGSVQINVRKDPQELLCIRVRNSVAQNAASSGGQRATGHGIGLEVSRTIVASLDGTLSLAFPSCDAAEFLVTVPIHRLTRS